MVSGNEKSTVVRSAFDKLNMTPLPEPQTVRIRFRKTGDLQYISHLDLQRVMSRVLMRSGVPVWFTQGFNPHPKMVFAMPLSVGTQSECEYLDIKIDRRIKMSEIAERINAQVTDEMRVTEVYRPQTKFSDIAYVTYDINIVDDSITEDTAKKAEKLLTTSPLNMIKKSKSGEREVDILQYVKKVNASFDGSLKISLTLTGGEGSLNPEMIVTAMREKLGILKNYPSSGRYTILRTSLLFADGKLFE